MLTDREDRMPADQEDRMPAALRERRRSHGQYLPTDEPLLLGLLLMAGTGLCLALEYRLMGRAWIEALLLLLLLPVLIILYNSITGQLLSKVNKL